MAKILLTILVAVLASVAANQCLPKTCRGKTHTMCLYSVSKLDNLILKLLKKIFGNNGVEVPFLPSFGHLKN